MDFQDRRCKMLCVVGDARVDDVSLRHADDGYVAEVGPLPKGMGTLTARNGKEDDR